MAEPEDAREIKGGVLATPIREGEGENSTRRMQWKYRTWRGKQRAGPQDIMGMRWVLSRKSDGRAQDLWSLCDVEAAAPTLSRIARNTLRACARP